MRQLAIERRIGIFKTLANSKIVYLALLTNTPNIITDELEKKYKKSLFGIIQHQKINNKLYIWTKKWRFKKCRYSHENSKPSMFLDQETLQ